MNIHTKVKCRETGENYPSIVVAAKNIGANAVDLKKIVNTETDIKGLHFETMRSYKTVTNVVACFITIDTPVKCVETKDIFSSIGACAEYYGITPSCIIAVVNNINKTSKAHHFITTTVDRKKIATKTIHSEVTKNTPIDNVKTGAHYKSVIMASRKTRVPIRTILKDTETWKVNDIYKKAFMIIRKLPTEKNIKTAMIKKYGSLETFRLTQFA